MMPAVAPERLKPGSIVALAERAYADSIAALIERAAAELAADRIEALIDQLTEATSARLAAEALVRDQDEDAEDADEAKEAKGTADALAAENARLEDQASAYRRQIADLQRAPPVMVQPAALPKPAAPTRKKTKIEDYVPTVTRRDELRRIVDVTFRAPDGSGYIATAVRNEIGEITKVPLKALAQ